MTTLFDSTGLTVDLADDIKTDLETDAQATWGSEINLNPDGALGHYIEQNSRILGQTNQALQALWNALTIPNSSGVPLSTLVTLVGLERQSEAYTTVTLTLTASTATTVLAGSLYGTTAGVNFATDEDLVFAAAGSDTVTATCTIPGDFNIEAGYITQKVTSVHGITAVTNAAATTPGRYQELDAELKNTHAIAVATSGEDDVNTHYEALSQVDGVSGIFVDENDDIGYIAAYVIGGSAEDIATAINNNRTAGVKTYGTSSYTLYNPTTRISKTIYYTVGSEVDIYVDINISTISSVFPDDGTEQISDYIVSEFEAIKMYEDVIYSKFYKAIYQVPGVIVNSLYIGTGISPTGTSNLTMAKNQKANISADNITITVS